MGLRKIAEELRRGSGFSAKCSMGQVIEMLPEEERAELQALLNDASYSARMIGAALRRRLDIDYPSNWVVGNHRRGGCSCRTE